jgi:3-hydroxybutyryl-CoA dehydrogenase
MKINDVKKIGVIGCGALGTTLAACAAPKYKVVVKRREISNGLDKDALQRIDRCFPSMIKRNTLKEEEKSAALANVSVTADFKDLKDCQVIFDATPDILEQKTEGLAKLNKICPPETIFLGTSACVSTTGLAAGSGRPDRTMMAHFLTPVHIFIEVETVPAIQTSQETIGFTEAYLKEGLGKTIIRVKDTPGLIQDYFLFAYMNHAIKLLSSGAATVEAIDAMVKAGFGVRLGPFELMDHLGMGSQIFSEMAIYDQNHSTAFLPPSLLTKMVEAGYHGRSAGKGWYIWDEQGKKIGVNKISF